MLPWWAWLLAIAFYPAGTFVALSAAKVLRWRLGVALAVAWYVALACALPHLAPLLEEDAGLTARGIVLALLLGVVVAVGYWQYRLGQRCNYWSDQAMRIWRIFAVLALLLLALNVLSWVAYAVLLRLVPALREA